VQWSHVTTAIPKKCWGKVTTRPFPGCFVLLVVHERPRRKRHDCHDAFDLLGVHRYFGRKTFSVQEKVSAPEKAKDLPLDIFLNRYSQSMSRIVTLHNVQHHNLYMGAYYTVKSVFTVMT
jgi:hypothetical protein